MAKELPYFKFEPAEYLTKNISFCSLSAQGLFSNICCYYWQRGCSITKDQILRRLNYPNELQELISEGIIDLNGEKISIKFLDKQLESAIEISQKNSQNGSKGGRPKKQEESEKKPTALVLLSETKAIREDKIKEEDIIEEEIKKDDILLEKETKFNISEFLIFQGAEKNLVKEWIAVRKLKKLANTQTAMSDFMIEVEKSQKGINDILKICIIKSWGGFKNKWLENESITDAKQNGNNLPGANISADGVQRSIGKQSHFFTGAEFSDKMQKRLKNQGIVD